MHVHHDLYLHHHGIRWQDWRRRQLRRALSIPQNSIPALRLYGKIECDIHTYTMYRRVHVLFICVGHVEVPQDVLPLTLCFWGGCQIWTLLCLATLTVVDFVIAILAFNSTTSATKSGLGSYVAAKTCLLMLYLCIFGLSTEWMGSEVAVAILYIVSFALSPSLSPLTQHLSCDRPRMLAQSLSCSLPCIYIYIHTHIQSG